MNRTLPAGLVLLLLGCADGAPGGPPSPAAASTAASAAHDGRYAGTITSISPPTCGVPGGRVVINITNGALAMRIGANAISGRVDGAGVISGVNVVSTDFTGTATGSGQVTDGRVSLQLQTFRPGGYVPCNFSYTATKAT